MSLESLRSGNTKGKLDRLIKAVGRTSAGNTRKNDDQEEKYYPERDKDGNGSCIIRFLPGLESEDYPYYVERFQHGFSHNNKWYIEFCPTTLGKDCPVCEDNFDTIGEYGRWNDCPKDVQNVIRNRGRNAGFRAGNYCNILVIKDPKNPENEGKVHLFSFGKGIMDMIMDMAQPKDDGLGSTPDPIDVFDLVHGANFKFIIFKKDERADYSKSCFEPPSPCPEFDEESQIPLLPLIDESVFMSYDELSDRFNKVMNKSWRFRNAEDLTHTPDTGKNRISKVEDKVSKPTDDVSSDPKDDDDDNRAYFQNIADDIAF